MQREYETFPQPSVSCPTCTWTGFQGRIGFTGGFGGAQQDRTSKVSVSDVHYSEEGRKGSLGQRLPHAQQGDHTKGVPPTDHTRDIAKTKWVPLSKLDISMQYCTILLNWTMSPENSAPFVRRFVITQFNRLPMSIKQAPDIAQEIVEDLLRPHEESEVYMDDVGIFCLTWDEHLYSLDKVISLLQSNNFTVNPLKCEWGVRETDWLGYRLTPRGTISKCVKEIGCYEK
jgi:Reverse transcriptase (RNA-dependent DNA polymerase)